jgi:hypothetical protein
MKYFENPPKLTDEFLFVSYFIDQLNFHDFFPNSLELSNDFNGYQ